MHISVLFVFVWLHACMYATYVPSSPGKSGKGLQSPGMDLGWFGITMWLLTQVLCKNKYKCS